MVENKRMIYFDTGAFSLECFKYKIVLLYVVCIYLVYKTQKFP
jgi:hypothetical protein